MIHITCRLTATNRDQLRNPTLGNRVWATFIVLCVVFVVGSNHKASVVGRSLPGWFSVAVSAVVVTLYVPRRTGPAVVHRGHVVDQWRRVAGKVRHGATVDGVVGGHHECRGPAE